MGGVKGLVEEGIGYGVMSNIVPVACATECRQAHVPAFYVPFLGVFELLATNMHIGWNLDPC